MPREELLNRSPIIDLISDSESDPTPLQVVDLTLLDNFDSSIDILSKSNMEVDAQTPSIISGCGQNKSSVVNQAKKPESDDSSSENAMTLSSILARGRKHKHGSNNTRIARPKPDASSLLQAQEGLRSFLGNKTSGPKTNFWTIHTPVSSQPALSQTQPKHKKKDEERKRTSNPIKQANPHILNIDIEEISSHKNKRRRGNKTPDQHGKLNGQRHVRSLSEEALSHKSHAIKTTDPTKLFNTKGNAGDEHTRKRPRLDGLGGATTNGVPQPSPNNYTNHKPPEPDRTVKDHCPGTITSIDVGKDDSTEDSLAGRPREGEIFETAGETNRPDRTNVSNKTSRGNPPPAAFDDLTSETSFSTRRRRIGNTVTTSQPNVTHGRPRSSSPVPGNSSVWRRKRPGENTQPLPSSSRQRPNRRNSGPANSPQPRRVSVESTTEDQWDGIKKVHERSLAEDAKRILSQSTQPNKTAGQKQQRKEETQASNHHVPAEQLPDDPFDSGTSFGVALTTNGVQRALEGYNKSQAGTHEHIDVGGSTVQNLSGGHVRQPEPLPQPKPQSKPSTIKLSTNPVPPEPSQSHASRKETFENAAASFNLLKSQYEKKRNSIILNSVPANFGMPSRASRTQAVHKASYLGRKPRRSAREAENKRMRYRERAIENKRKKLEEEYADEPGPYRETLVNEKLDEYRQKFVENDRKRKAQAESYLTVDFLEDGVGADDDDDADNKRADDGRQHRAPAARRNGAIPASQAMGPNEVMVLYAVYISEPFEEGQNYEDHMQRAAEAFLKKDEANAFAQKLLTGTCSSSSSSRQPVQNPTSVQYDHDVDGLLFGRKRLPDGKVVCCMVEKEKQVFGLLDMSNKWVREEAKDLYRPRYDIFYTNVIPKVFLDKEEEYKKKREEQKAKESAEKEANAKKKPEEGEVQGMEKGREESPWIWNLGDEDEDSNRLFSSTPSPQTEACQGADQEADDENSSQASDHDEDDDDTASVASSATLKPTHPGGALGKLSWADVEYFTIHAASYTDLRLANEEALKVALVIWKPRTSRLDAWTRYDYEVVPSIEEARNDMDLDADRVEIEFEVPEVGGPVDHRPWLFVHSRVYVVESKLEGPRDIACDFVVADGEDE
ncbi:hypothetical protein VM1G_00484 [Cytospora mali]|uniref:Uncharacterized protein n=1 Tax=Cytospora mali TaxID=578113 RepID=A0A194VMZ3_CYTMA|nr:hypothetical protein VM1G_00484 [Valsa mali]